MKIMQKIDEIISARHMLNHPFYEKWACGELTRAQLQEYAKDYYLHMKRVPSYVLGLATAAQKNGNQNLAQILNAAHDEEQKNIALWEDFAAALGVEKSALHNHEFSDAAKKKCAIFEKFCNENVACVAPGLAALYAYEKQVPDVAREKIRGLKEYFDVTDEAAVAYFATNEESDVRHANNHKEQISALATSDFSKNQAILAADEVTRALYDFLDGFLAA